ncbi:MAG: M20/M25/M40 family metallo-hydrolase [Gemmatimonadota bacterium]
MIRRVYLLAFAAVTCTTPLAAQQLTGFTPARSAREVALEQRLQAVPDTASARRHAHVLAGRPHVAGTPAQKATADYVLRQMRSWGLDTSRVTYRVYLPYHDSTVVERITPTRLRLDLVEPPVPGDSTTQLPTWPAMNGNSGAGDVTAALVYVNYGLPTDYARLDSLGVSVRGKVAIVRYGRSFRGIKAREAELHGASALLIYSDPFDDGFTRGEVYPAGPYRNAQGVQRGSIYNGTGDPTTPGWASTANAQRIAEDSLDVPHIPVVPIGYGNAELLMRGMSGAAVPDGWQGGMNFPYHVGDGGVSARVAVWPERGNRAYKSIYDTFGMIRGSEFPDEWVIIGGHRDGWGPGAADNVSGTVSILEAARAWGAALRAGERPRRTLVFATWDAEEWGLVGSTEWVESRPEELQAKAVAYINQDVAASGRSFGASGTASLHGVLRDLTHTVTQPGDTGSVYQKWSRPRAGSTATVPSLGDLGGGSDFTGFYNHLGIPAVEFGFGGAGGVYHSAYDTWGFMERFGDVGYLSHAAAGRLSAVLLARLANADILPFDHAALGTYLAGLASRVERSSGATGLSGEFLRLRMAATGLAQAAGEFNRMRDSVLASGTPSPDWERVNGTVRRLEQQLTRASGLMGRPFMRNLIFAADRDNGYANIALPGVSEALRDHDQERARGELTDLRQRIEAATVEMRMATAALAPS